MTGPSYNPNNTSHSNNYADYPSDSLQNDPNYVRGGNQQFNESFNNQPYVSNEMPEMQQPDPYGGGLENPNDSVRYNNAAADQYDDRYSDRPNDSFTQQQQVNHWHILYTSDMLLNALLFGIG